MSQPDGFYTMKGYAINADGELTSAMEDYLEMIFRLTRPKESVRVSDLSKMLHVKTSSATKMVQQLGLSGFIQAEKYGDIYLTDKGRETGKYLLYRHEVIHRFLCALNHSDNELEQVEKIEHFLDPATVKNLERLTAQLTEN
ncbi:MAG: iron dependent repressor, metal binding and dimerization domain protein [Oscillospiraceae bacterium]|nr:iron dependent repressor, metal binding and dimerization domain protein [Oscillospiraceae bacterium]